MRPDLALQCLKRIRAELDEPEQHFPGFIRRSGICINFNNIWDECDYHWGEQPSLYSLFKSWGLDGSYPVMATREDAEHLGIEADAFDWSNQAKLNEAVFDASTDLWAGEYGARRIALLDRLIQHYAVVCADSQREDER
jgi:hypothetical protein